MKRFPLLLLLLITLAGPLTGTLTTGAAQPTSNPVPIITVTKTDGTAVKGKLVSAEWDKVVLTVDGTDQTLKWNEITRLSNGLTRAKIIETFKKENKDKLCPDCAGNHDKRCDTCKGTGHLAAAVENCAQCKGELLIKCRTPKCKEGQIPCPNTCLKRGEGKWVEQDGKTVRFFGNSWFSEGHVGELIVKEGNHYTTKGKCPTCDGKTTLPDPACETTGKIPCPTHSKATTNPCATCEADGRIDCETCKTTGLAK